MRKLIATTAVLTGLIGSTLVAEPAAAAYNQGVKSVSYAHSTDSCAPAQLGCTPGAGEGSANVIRITQVDTVEGGRAFRAHETTAQLSGNLWMAATLGAECRAGYTLESARIGLGAKAHDFQEGKGPEEVSAWSGIPVSVPHDKTMASKKLALNIPLSLVLPSEAEHGAGAYGYVLDFGSIDDVYAYGEHVIDQRIANGMTEAQARAQAFSFTTHIPTHAEGAARATGPQPAPS